MTIIVIDDDPQCRALTVRTLARAGYSTQSGNSAIAALDLARGVGDVAMIILDVHMPGATGFDALQILKADPILKDIPVLMVSATIDAARGRPKARQLGAIDLLNHPVSDGELLGIVKQAIGRRRTATESSND